MKVTVDDRYIGLVQINRPPHNYFDADLLRELAESYEALDRNEQCRVIVLAASGRNFCAGLRFGKSGDPSDDPAAIYRQGIRLFRTRKPVIAAIHGAAIGGGLGLALTADFRVADPGSRFTGNFSRIGLHPGFAITTTLPRLVGPQRALEWLLSGRDVYAPEALGTGLVDSLSDPGEVQLHAMQYARRLAAAAPLAVTSIRATMRAELLASLDATIAHELVQQQTLQRSADFREGIAAAAERREPHFTGH